MNLPLLPTDANFYGFFLTIPASFSGSAAGIYTNWDFATQWKPQIDAIKNTPGANFVVLFGAAVGDHGVAAPWVGSPSNLVTYLAECREVLDYCYKSGLYVMVYGVTTELNWYPGTLTYADAIPTLVAHAALCAEYPNVIGFVLVDEPYANGNTTPLPTGANLTTMYNDVKAGVPSNFPIAAASNPCGNYIGGGGADVWNYSGSQNQGNNLDAMAPICDFFVFHPFYAPVLSDTSALRAAYPNKQIIMPSSVAQTNAATAAADCTAIMALVGANNFRGMGVWEVLDEATAYGFFNSDYTPRATQVNAFKAGVSGTFPRPMTKQFRGIPALNQSGRWGLAA